MRLLSYSALLGFKDRFLHRSKRQLSHSTLVKTAFPEFCKGHYEEVTRPPLPLRVLQPLFVLLIFLHCHWLKPVFIYVYFGYLNIGKKMFTRESSVLAIVSSLDYNRQSDCYQLLSGPYLTACYVTGIYNELDTLYYCTEYRSIF